MKKVAKRRVERQDNENEDDNERDRRNGVVKTVRPCAARVLESWKLMSMNQVFSSGFFLREVVG
jgi:hypothetical protein